MVLGGILNIRSPPQFVVSYPEEGVFSIRTNNEFRNDAKISIYLNNKLVLNEKVEANKEYTIVVPAGNNLIKVDNLGSDWATISSYRFTGIGSKVDAYTLLSEDKTEATGWVLNHEYNHQYIQENGLPDPIIGAGIIIEDFRDGNYLVKWYDCLIGQMLIRSETYRCREQSIILANTGIVLGLSLYS